MQPRLDTFEPRTAHWRQWQLAEPILAGHDFTTVRRALLDRTVPLERKDELLSALLRLSRSTTGYDAQLALIACLLPGVRKLAGQFARTLGWDDAVSEAVAALCVAVGRFDAEHHHHHVAGRLLTAARRRLVARARWEWSWRERSSAQVDLNLVPAPPPVAGHSVIADALNVGVLSTLDAALIEATRLNGLSLVDAATLLGVSYEAAKKRRRRAEAAWFTWWTLDHRVDRAPATRAAA